MTNCLRKVGGCLISGLLLMMIGCSSDEVVESPLIKHVKVQVVGKESIAELRRISGRVVAADQSQLSFGVAGTIASFEINSGDEFVQGQVLASLDAAPLRIAVEQTRALVAVSRAKSKEAEQAFNRTQDLSTKGAASRAELEAATASLESARGSLRSESASLERKERDLAMTQITAPFAGKVSERLADPYEEVSASQAVLAVQTSGLFEVEVSIPETLIRQVDYGQVVRVTFPSAEDVLDGVITEIGAQAGASSAYPVKVRLSSEVEGLRAGMTASVELTLAQQTRSAPVYLIPLSAIAIDAQTSPAEAQGSAPVFVIGADMRLEIRRLTIGDIRGNELEVYDGLVKGDQVVVAGVPFLSEGMQVEVWQGLLADG